ncbi:hypothetical protein [Rodentibacter ratti]|uniref:Uncharacterized protein n=1 Tax=Rodentibacter ratti TaxID=1906745 RepID=A0A1V3L6Z7_9PAST|nr:hypothetical protein [Rodentibacter ratti]OOF85719.1 hypothetical protein BKG88_06985 [Rodentibacter ratti]
MANAVKSVLLGTLFKKEFKNFPELDRKLISKFIKHIYDFGFENLEGANKSSDNVRWDDPYFIKKVRYAIDNHLWHYHIGIKQYDTAKPYGQRTSEFVLHYQLLNNGEEIRIVDYSSHPPFKLPSIAYLSIETE